MSVPVPAILPPAAGLGDQLGGWRPRLLLPHELLPAITPHMSAPRDGVRQAQRAAPEAGPAAAGSRRRPLAARAAGAR